jgi:hypothetical protein
MMTLTFRSVRNETTTVVRGAFFRICPDGTLRGPDNMVMANYANGLWQLAQKSHRSFECGGEVYLRVTDAEGRHARAGPYQAVKVTRGAIFSGDIWLGIHASAGETDTSTDRWHQVTLLEVALA